MDDRRATVSRVERLTAAVETRRSVLGASLAGLAATLSAAVDGEARTRSQKNRRRRRKRRDRRRSQNHGGNGGRGSLGDIECFVCEELSDGPNCLYTSIQAAIDAARNGAVIGVCNGTYKERLSIRPNTAPNLTLVGSGSKDTVIDGEGDGSTLSVAPPSVFTIELLTITGGSASFGGGVHNRGSLTIKNSVVTGNDTGTTPGGGGGIYNDGGRLTLLETVVEDNTSLAGQGGGILNSGELVVQTNTRVTSNNAKQGGGLFNQTGGTVSIDPSSTVAGNSPDNCAGATC